MTTTITATSSAGVVLSGTPVTLDHHNWPTIFLDGSNELYIMDGVRIATHLKLHSGDKVTMEFKD